MAFLYKEDSVNNENQDGEQEVKEEKPVNPNSYIPVIENMYKLFGEVFLDNKMEPVKDNKEVFDCTLLGILFSAGWGSPCRIFYKDLINIYNQMNDGEKVFEIIQVSFDAKEEDFKKAISGLPWKFLPLNFKGINEFGFIGFSSLTTCSPSRFSSAFTSSPSLCCSSPSIYFIFLFKLLFINYLFKFNSYITYF